MTRMMKEGTHQVFEQLFQQHFPYVSSVKIAMPMTTARTRLMRLAKAKTSRLAARMAIGELVLLRQMMSGVLFEVKSVVGEGRPDQSMKLQEERDW